MEIIRQQLIREGLPVSARDVFIKGNPAELDLLIHRPSAKPEYGIVFDPEDVAVVLEIKNSGVYDKDSAASIAKRFHSLQTLNLRIQCVYLTICENQKFKAHITTESLGFQAFTLCWVNSTRTQVTKANDWKMIVDHIRQAVMSF